MTMFCMENKASSIPQSALNSLDWRLSFFIAKFEWKVRVVRKHLCYCLLIRLPKPMYSIVAKMRFGTQSCELWHDRFCLFFSMLLLLLGYLLFEFVQCFHQECIDGGKKKRSIDLLLSHWQKIKPTCDQIGCAHIAFAKIDTCRERILGKDVPSHIWHQMLINTPLTHRIQFEKRKQERETWMQRLEGIFYRHDITALSSKHSSDECEVIGPRFPNDVAH